MAITSVTKDGGYLIIVEDGITKRRSIVYEDTVCSLPPYGHFEVGNITINASGQLVVNYNGSSITLVSSVGLYLPLAGGTMAGAIAMGANLITGLADPVAAQDAATRAYVLAQCALYLPLTGAYVHPNHTGEVTSLADGAQTIANDAVTYAKMQNVSATDKVLGRVTAGAGDAEEIACTAAGRALLDDVDAAAQKTTLSLNLVENTAHSTDAHTMTIDGRDVSVDGTKLDTIATNADVTADNAPKAHEASHQTGGADILYVPRTYAWFISGTVATGTEQGATFRMKRATIVEDIELHVKTAPTGAALIVDINEAGTTIFTTKPEIDAAGTTEDNNHSFSDTALAAAAELTMDIDQVGSTIAGADLTVLLHCKEAVI